MEIADKCPVHRTLHAEINIRTTEKRRMIVIVGAGQAAAQLVLSLRQGGYKEPIRMIGDEPYAPYQRPPLSKKFLTERPPAETLYFRPEKFWRDQGVTADFGVPVASIDRAAKRVTVADGHVDYEHAVSRRPARARATCRCPARDLDGVFSLRKIDDVRAPARRRWMPQSTSSSSAAAISGSRSRRSRAARGARSPCWRPRTA